MLFWSQSCLVLYLICFPLCPYSNSVYIFQHFIAWVSMNSVCCFHRQHFHSLLCFAECLANSAIEIYFSPWLANSCWLYHTFCAWPLTHGIWFQDFFAWFSGALSMTLLHFVAFLSLAAACVPMAKLMKWSDLASFLLKFTRTKQYSYSQLDWFMARCVSQAMKNYQEDCHIWNFFLSSLSYRTILI